MLTNWVDCFGGVECFPVRDTNIAWQWLIDELNDDIDKVVLAHGGYNDKRAILHLCQVDEMITSIR